MKKLLFGALLLAAGCTASPMEGGEGGMSVEGRAIESWKRTMDGVEASVIVPAHSLEFPSKAEWDQIKKRGPEPK